MPNKLRVTLTYSENQYLPYPCTGLLELFELGSNGSVIVGVFQRDGESGETGYRHAPVRVSRPVFNYPGEQVQDQLPEASAAKKMCQCNQGRIPCDCKPVVQFGCTFCGSDAHMTDVCPMRAKFESIYEQAKALTFDTEHNRYVPRYQSQWQKQCAEAMTHAFRAFKFGAEWRAKDPAEPTIAMVQAACAAFRLDVSPMEAMRAALCAALSTKP